MSLILDALRKSEHERQRSRGPGIADVRAPRKQKDRSLWVPLVALLAGLNLALLALLWYSGRPANDTTAAVTQPAPASPPALARSLVDELEPVEPARFASIAPPAATTPAPPPAAEPPAPSAVIRKADLPTVTEGMLDGTLNIAPLHLDIHVYSANPRERFVFINTSRYGEGERINEGPTIEAINEEGVILGYQGNRFLLLRD